MGSPHRRPLTTVVPAVIALSLFVILLSATGADAACETSCGAGTYYATANDTCLQCPAGHYCEGNSTAPTPCSAGTASSATGASLASTCSACSGATYAPADGATSCDPCPQGFSCSASAATGCAGGDYSPVGVASCSPCPAGMYCDVNGPNSCPEGQYQPATGQSSCLDCPSGSYCANPAIAPVSCPAGTFSPALQTNCTQCASGFYSTGGAGSCTPCDAGDQCSNPTAAGVPCPAGTSSSAQSTSCTPCADGSYQSATGQSSCTPCPAGKSCADPTVAPVDCPAGTFSAEYQTNCTQCATGHYSLGNTGSCTPCTAGHECSNPAVAEQNCPAGTYSGAQASSCSPCPDGTYQVAGGQPSCDLCPAGKSCLNPAAAVACPVGTSSLNGQANCTACPSGYFSLGDVEVCSPCTAGSQCSDPTASPVGCPAGTFSNALATSCTQCPEGSFASGTGNPSCGQCGAGKSCFDGTGETNCLPGTFSIASQANCTVCPAGTYQSSPGQASCLECPAGSDCTNPTTATACSAGQFNPQGSASSCQSCALGEYQPAGGNGACIACPVGTHCLTPSVSTACPLGTFNPAGSTTGCRPCNNGTYTPTAPAGSCTLCPAGYDCTNPATATQCPAGTYNPLGSKEPCQTCADGFVQDSAGQASCYQCPPGQSCADKASTPTPCANGQYSPSGTLGCLNCPTGTTTNNVTGAASCSPCPPGQSCLDPLNPTTCPDGQYASGGGSSLNCTTCPIGYTSNADKSGCTACPAGSECGTPGNPTACTAGSYSTGGQVIACTPCPAGQQCFDAASSPTICPTGTFSLGGTINCTDCPAGASCGDPSQSPVTCPAGSYSAAAATSCTECPPGFACAVPTALPVACPEGQYSTGNATSCSLCEAGFACYSSGLPPVACPVGYYSLAGNQSCIECPAGSACETNSSPPRRCSVGLYATPGATNCTACPPGFECPSPEIYPPITCTPGTFSTGLQANCTDCPAGSQCPFVSANIIQPCAPGSYSTGRATACTPCPAGSACPDPASATIQPCAIGTYAFTHSYNCTLCQPGWECPTTTGSMNQQCLPGTFAEESYGRCQPCPPGKYCPSTTNAVVLDCGAGTYTSDNMTSCISCPPGQECPNPDGTGITACTPGTYSTGGQAACTVCSAGSYCPPGVETTGVETICPPGEFSAPGATACTVCPAGEACYGPTDPGQPCPQGFYSLGGARNCTQCPPGYECSNPAIPPVPCPLGFYSIGQAVICTPCQPGWVCPQGSTTPTPAGQECSPGRYCNPATAETQCPPGTFGNSSGLSDITGCLACTAGQFCPLGTANPNLNECPRGHYCPTGTSFGTEFPCSLYTGMATYNDELGKVRLEDCKICPAGRFCPDGSIVGTECTWGNYCPQGVQAPVPCPGGSYSGAVYGLKAANECLPCPVGNYCPAGSYNPIQCQPGTYNPDDQSAMSGNCVPCDAGMACDTSGLSSPNKNCAMGHFCPNGTLTSNQNPCPPGTKTDETNLFQVEQCDLCPGRFWCGWATGGASNPPTTCPAGFYCPPGTSYPNQFPCPPGTFSNRTGLINATECTTCPAGSWCAGIGETAPSGACSAGHYCPAATSVSTANPCPAGTWTDQTNLYEAAQCYPCSPGHYCLAGSSSETDCPPGSYVEFNNTGTIPTPLSTAGLGVDADTCKRCPAGSYCPAASPLPLDCGIGKYSDVGLGTPCPDCQLGHYCPTSTTSQTDMLTNRRCEAGTYCAGGQGPQPDFVSNACPVGQYCVEATVAPQNCPVGSYNPSTGRANITDCLTCPAGKYCLEGVANVTGDCDAGHYCPAGSYGPQQFPCPTTTYRALAGAEKLEDCVPCQYGRYCGQASVIGLACPRGYYCLVGVDTPEPCPIGTFGNSTGLRQVEECTDCPPGRYCDGSGLPNPRGPCDPGYYCSGRAFTSAPPGPPTGGLCPPGGYCPVGSSVPTACAPGTFNNHTGGRTQLDCSFCTPGFYCAGSNNPYPTGPCLAGYYCTAGAQDPTGIGAGGATPPGTYTVEGSPAPIPCDPGTYSPTVRAADACRDCIPKFHCPFPGATNMTVCPVGHYCPTGTANAIPCPIGTYRNAEGQSNITSCFECPPGKYCGGEALLEPSGDCNAGHYCLGRVETPIPFSEALQFGAQCPTGRYCPAGTGSPQPVCPPGTYNDAVGLGNITGCVSCPEGQYCNLADPKTPTGACAAGYFCNAGSTTDTPTGGTAVVESGGPLGVGGPCPQGFYCPSPVSSGSLGDVGTYSPIPCPAGSTSNRTGLAVCDECPAGYYCDVGNVEPIECPSGSYCPGNSSLPQPCPRGTFNNVTRLQAIGDCMDCLGGMYCASTGLTWPTGQCLAGSYCTSKNIYPDGDQRASHSDGVGVGNICITGHYCPIGSTVPLQCAVGTISGAGVTGLTAQADCQDCPPGKYCSDPGRSTPNGDCAPGYYCVERATADKPIDGCAGPNGNGDICPPGKYCPTGSAQPLGCVPGTYQPSPGNDTCLDCPSGYYCPANSTTFIDCPSGYYCPQNTGGANDNPCPIGTYGNRTNLQNVTMCTDCPPGYYCLGSETTPTGICDAGYYCIRNSHSNQPSVAAQGGRCTAGHYCPAGTPFMIPCDGGQYCETDGLNTTTGPCDAGYYCVSRASVARPPNDVTGGICPTGYYCPQGTDANWVPCPLGTFNPNLGMWAPENCTACTPGQYCQGANLSTPTGPCAEGYFCSSGAQTATPVDGSTGDVCPIRSYCPGGDDTPTLCPPGSYQPNQGNDTCITCPAGSYCPSNNTLPISCPAGAYCPEGTTYDFEYLCPNGTYSNAGGLQNVTQCTPCPPTKYCEGMGQTSITGDCDQGYYCISAAKTARPLDGVTGGACFPGTYCPPASSNYTYCPPGEYCETWTLAAPTGNCTAGFYCLGGAVQAAPNVTEQGGQCPPGFYCGVGSKNYTDKCPQGTYNPHWGQTQITDCLQCPGALVCSREALASPDGECAPGHFCTLGAMTDKPLKAQLTAVAGPGSSLSQGDICPTGHYCPGNTSVPLVCPPGYYQDNQGNHTCFDCPEGYSCTANTTTPVQCPVGYYCPLRTTGPNQHACPLGTFNPVPGSVNSTSCLDCTAGSYCNETGLSATSGVCAPGYYCSGRSPTETPPGSASYGGQCAAGQYCPVGSPNPRPCDAGKYCIGPLQDTVTSDCAAGFYCVSGASTPTPTDGVTGDVCPPGWYCPIGTDNFTLACPPGTFRTLSQASNDSQCTDCTPGSFCGGSGLTTPTAICAAGHYCTLGAASATPVSSNLNRYGNPQGDLCPVGHYCPAGSDSPRPCNAGTYQNQQGNDTCNTCPAGFYCEQAASNIVTCPPGSYCPAGTQNATQFLCPPGTYNNNTNRKALADCLDCPPGRYCETPGLSTPTGLCNSGWFCSGGARTAQPANSTGTGGHCLAGYYCPTGSYDMTLCDVGSYCLNDQLASPSGLCQAGFYCSGGAKVSNPNPAGPTGGPCPVGYYCPFGFAAPQPCPDGTYSNTPGIVARATCTPCDGGQYCVGAARTNSSGPCSPGHYCTIGSKLKNPLGQANHLNTTQGDICPAGNYCPEASPYPLACAAGTYAPSAGFSVCSPCPAGYYCIENTTTPAICPSGYYCPENTTSVAEFPCTNGTFNNATGLSAQSQCLSCSPGKFCSGFGLVEPVGDCAPGYICYSGARVPNPSDGTEGIECPRGSYCPSGTTAPIQCNAGFWNSLTGQDQVGDCQPCPVGKACNSSGIFDLTDFDCPAGYVCEGGAYTNPPTVADPGGQACAPGKFCPTGSAVQQGCAPGTYNPNDGQSSCTTCDAGFYCPYANMTSKIPCPPGYYCTAGLSTPTPCPAGTYSADFYLAAVGECTDCPTGYYCADANITAPSGACSAGYFCETKATQPQPTNAGTGIACDKKTVSPPLDPQCNGICPAGYYCPNGTQEPVPCQPGYYNPNTGGDDVTVCVPCTAGSYCASQGLSAPDGPCDPGFFCNGGVTGTSPTGNPCPPGHRCPSGSATPIACAETHYQPSAGQAACIICPAGSWCARCEINTNCTANSTVAKVCPVGYYCPEGTDHPVPCPPGTIGLESGLDNVTQCDPCPAGKYCTDGSNALDCSPGYLCITGNRYPNPSNGQHYEADGVTPVLNAGDFPANLNGEGFNDPTARKNGYPCPTGYYCPAATLIAIPCNTGTVRTRIGGTQQGDCTLCPAGFRCDDNNAVACAKGEYCPFGELPQKCPVGTYGPTIRATAVEDCLTCPAGYHCNATGLGDYASLFCPLGHYCPGDRANPDPVPCKPGSFRDSNAVLGTSQASCTDCPAGYFCPCTTKDFCERDPLGLKVCQIGATNKRVCPGGYYCPAVSDAPIACPARTYCSPGAKNVTACPAGFYCPERTVAPRTCPAGSYCPAESGDKQLCPGGFKCVENTTVPVACNPGVSCAPGCGVSKDFTCDVPCPSGFYCPARSAYPEPCPAGTKAAFDPTQTTTTGIVTTVTNTGGGQSRTSVADSCVACPDGYAGEHPTRQNCTICEPGFVCLTGGGHTTRPANITQNGYPCPAGHYCPAGTSRERPCPAGTYRPDAGGIALSSCIDCPAGSFNSEPGATACTPCGASAFSEAGAAQCVCNGTNRAFQPSDGSCRCKSGYRFLNDKFVEEDGDDPRDCQPIVFERCSNNNEVRNLDSGKCEPRTEQHGIDRCKAMCTTPDNQDGLGTFYDDADICECADTKDVNDICDANCQRNQIRLKYIPTDPNNLYLVTPAPDSQTYTYDISTASAFSGSFKYCTTQYKECDIKIVVSNDVGNQFQFNSDKAYYDFLITGKAPTRRRLLQTTTLGNIQAVDQPMVCIKEGEAVIWDVSSGADNYPVYVRDSLYNTNPSFDDGEFRRLATRKLNANTTVQLFAHSFNQAGTYVFVNNNNRDRRMFVTVVLQNEKCATSSGVQPVTSQNLVTMGVSKNRSIILSPDYWLIGALLLALVIIVGLVIWMFWYVRRKSWANSTAAGIQYRRLGQAHEFGQYASKGSTVAKRMKFKGTGDDVDMEAYRDNFWDYERQVDLEGFNVKTLYDKLEDQTIHVTSQLAEHKEHVRAFFDKISAQTELLGSLLDNRLGQVADAAAWGASAAGGVDDIRSPEERKAAAEAKKNYMKQYEEILKEERENLEQDERAREQYDGTQQGVVDEVEMLNSNLVSEVKQLMADPTNDGHRRAVDQISQVLKSKMDGVTDARQNEAGRRGVATSDDDVVGCFILDPVNNAPVPLHRLTDERGNLKNTSGLIHKDEKLGLFVPESNLKMQRLDTGEVLPIPSDYCVHPRTGLVVPIAGHVGVDKNGALKLADTMADEPLPFVKAPEKETFYRDPATGEIKPPAINMLRGIAKDTPLAAGAKMLDPTSGKMVPVLGVTVDPMSNSPLPVGGTMLHPVTGELVPIELDAPMLDPLSGEIVPITGVAIDSETGQVIPIGGKAVNINGELKPIMAGFKALDDVSGKPRVVTGATVDNGSVVASTAGGFAVPDNGELAAEQVYHQALADMRDIIQDSIEDFKRAQEDHQAKLDANPNMSAVERASLEAQHEMDLSNLRLDLEDAVDDQEEIIKEALQALDSAREKNRIARAKRRNRLRLKDQQNRKIMARGGRAAEPQSVAANAEQLLQEEINARAAAQRRQKNLQNDIEDIQGEIAHILRDAANGELSPDQIEEVMELQDRLQSNLADLQDSTNSEAQRRIRALNNLKGKVGQDVLEELTSNDASEKAAVDKFVDAQKGGISAIQKVLNKIRDQEEYYHDHMAELRAQGNPDAIEAFERHHQEVMRGLYQELNDQIKKNNGETRSTMADMNMAKEQARLQREDAADIMRSETDQANASSAANPSLQALARANPDMALLLRGLVGGGGAEVDPLTNLLVPSSEPSEAAKQLAASMKPLPGETEEEMIERMLREAGNDVAQRALILEAQKIRQQEALAAKLAARNVRDEYSPEVIKMADSMQARPGETEDEMIARLLAEAGDDVEKKNLIMDAQKLRQQEQLAAKLAARRARGDKKEESIAEAMADSMVPRPGETEEQMIARMLAEAGDDEAMKKAILDAAKLRQQEALAAKLAARQVRDQADPQVASMADQIAANTRPGETEEEAVQRLLKEAGGDQEKKKQILAAQKLRQEQALAEKLAARKARAAKKGGKPAALPGEPTAVAESLPEAAQAQLAAAEAAKPLPGETEEEMRQRLMAAAGDDERRRVEVLEQQKMRQAKLLEDKLAERRAKAAAKAARVDLEVTDKTTTDELEKAQQQETEALMADLEEEADLELEALETRVDLDQQANIERKKAEMKSALADPGLDAAERERIQAQFQAELKALESNQWNEKQRQKQELQRKLEERRRKKLNAQALKHAQDHKTVAINEASDEKAGDILAEEQAKEREAQEAALAAESAAEKERLETHLEEQQEDIVAEVKARHERALANLDPNASEEERARLEREFQDEMNRLNGVIDSEKARQKNSLEEKIAARRLRKQKEQQARQEREQRELLLKKQQHEERLRLQEEQEKEQSALDAEIEAEIERELAQQGVKVTKEELKHDKEVAQETEKLEKAKEKIVHDASLDAAERDRLLAQFDSEINKLNSSLSSEKERQRATLRDKVAQRKAAKAAAMKRKQEEEAQRIAAKQAAEAAELEAKIARDLAKDLEEAVNAEVEKELEQEVKKLEEKHEDDTELEKAKLEREVNEKLNNDNLTEEERERITREHEEALKALEQNVGAAKARQEADLKRKLEERRAAKLAKQKRAAAAEELSAIVPEVEMPTGPTPEELALQAEQERKQRELEARQAEEKKALEAAAAEETRAAEAKAAAEMEKEKKRILHEQQQRNAADLAAMQGLSDAEKARIVDEHKRELAQLEGNLDTERARQQKAMKEKLAARKAAKAKALARKQDKETARELTQAEKEKAALEQKITARAEEKAIQKAKEVVGEDQVEDAVALVLKQRHEKELNELAARHMKEKTTAVSDAIAKINDGLDEKKDLLAAQHAEQLEEFEKQSENVDAEDREEDLKALQVKQAGEMTALEQKASEDKTYTEKNALRETEARHAYELLGMRERHAREIITRSEESSPEDILRRQQGFEAEAAAAEIANFKANLEADKKARLEKMKKERREFEEAKKKEMEAELAKFEEQLKAEEERDKERNQKRMEEIEARKAALVAQREADLEKTLEAKGSIDSQQREAIIEEHTAELKNLTNALDTERERQKQKLQEKLEKQKAAKRQRKLAKEQEKLKMSLKEREAAARDEKKAIEAKAREDKARLKAAEKQAEADAQQQREAQSRAQAEERAERQAQEQAAQAAAQAQQQQLQLQQQQAAASAAQPVAAAPAAAGVAPSSAGLVAALQDARSDAEWLDLLTKSPLMTKLRQIEDMLRSGDLKVGAVAGAKVDDDVASGGSKPSGPAYVDPRDSQWEAEGSLETVETADLSAVNFIVYKFGCHVVDLLTVQSSAEVNLLVASSLPKTNYGRNAFKNSYYYEDSTKTLFIREQRVQSAGDFVLVLVHALSHVKCRSFDDDTNPAFLREFYKNLRTVCGELFFAKSKRDSIMAPSGTTPSAVEGMFGRLPVQEKTDFVSDLMHTTLEADPSDEYSKGSLIERLENFGGMTMNAQLRDYLTKLEENVSSGKTDALDEQRQRLEAASSKKAAGKEDSVADRLRKRISELEDQNDALTSENMKDIMTVNKLKQSTRALVAKLTKASGELDSLTEGTPEHTQLSEKVQELTSQIGKAKTALRRANTAKENSHKRLQALKEELESAQKQLESQS